MSKIPLAIKQQMRIKTLEVENEALEEIIKNKLYKGFRKMLSEPYEIERLRKENKRLRIKLKTIKEEK